MLSLQVTLSLNLNVKNLATLHTRLENKLEFARTSRDTGKTPPIN